MGLKALQIADLTNPISLEYVEFSRQSLACVSDIIDLEPFQCITPKDLPDWIKDVNDGRSPTEKAALISHYTLMSRVADGEDILIMEHDAHLWPQHEQLFRQLLSKTEDFSVAIYGIAVECYRLSQSHAKMCCEMIKKESLNKRVGPLGLLHAADDKRGTKHKAMWPLKGSQGKLCISDTVTSAFNGKGDIVDAPITQHVSSSLGVTIDSKKRPPINKQNNPNVFFT